MKVCVPRKLNPNTQHRRFNVVRQAGHNFNLKKYIIINFKMKGVYNYLDHSNWLSMLLWILICYVLVKANGTLVKEKLLEEKEISKFHKFENSSKKACPGTVVAGITSARQLQGCTVIKGDLEIAIHEECQNIVIELEKNLKDISVIEGFLRVLRSHPLTSLDFLRNLVEIRGNDLGFKDYSLLVLDNLNLEKLWSWENRESIKIGSMNGSPKILFHYNPKLCLQTIEELRIRSGLKPFSNIDVSSMTNGDKVMCNTTESTS